MCRAEDPRQRQRQLDGAHGEPSRPPPRCGHQRPDQQDYEEPEQEGVGGHWGLMRTPLPAKREDPAGRVYFSLMRMRAHAPSLPLKTSALKGSANTVVRQTIPQGTTFIDFIP